MENTSDPLNFYSRIAAAAARFPDRVAIEQVRADGLEATTYRELLDRAGRFAGALQASGFGRGDRAAILADNDARWIAAYLGILRVGGVAVPLDTAYKAAQVRVVAENSGARLLCTTPRYCETARAAADLLGSGALRLVLLTDDSTFACAGGVPDMADVGTDQAAVILYTSGTTADPKGVVLTHANLDAERLGAFAIVHVDEEDAILGVLPLFHALAQMANLLLPLTVGARVVFLDTVSSTTLLKALQERGITIFACVPQFFYLIHQRVMTEVRHAGSIVFALFRAVIQTNVWFRDRLGWNPGRRLFARVHRVLGPNMRLLVTGGSKFDPAIGRDLYGLGFTILNAYGLTETSGGATIVRPNDRLTESVGQPFPGVEIKISGVVSGGSGPSETTPEILDGEVLIRGPIVMREYFNRPDATGEALKDGWLYTGDLGKLDEQGRLYITGRKKEIIVLSSGKNLYPEEIEAHYRQSEFIKELCVLGLSRPGEPAAERLHGVLVPDETVLRERGIVNLRELVRFELESLSVKLPPHKRILSYDIWLEALPRTTTGKLRRHEIERRVRERAAAATAAVERPLTESERDWLVDPDNAAAMAVIQARVEQARVRPDANLELDLGLDSMERVEVLTLLEQRHSARVANEARAAIFTVRQLVDSVRAAGSATGHEGSADQPGELPWETILTEEPTPELLALLRRDKTGLAIFSVLLIKTLALLARLFLRYRTTGQEHLPREGPFIISPNHQSYMDGFFLIGALPLRVVRRLFIVGQADQWGTPFRARVARLINIVPVDPDSNLVMAMKAGAAGLRLNKVLLLFPEGERTIDGEVKKFRKGAAILSAHTNSPIVPVAMNGLFQLWPRRRSFNWRGLLPWRATPVRVAIGPAMTAKPGRYTEDTAALRRAVVELFEHVRART